MAGLAGTPGRLVPGRCSMSTSPALRYPFLSARVRKE